MGNLPKLTDEQRKAALERAAQARRERTELKSLVKKGKLSFSEAVADDRAKRMYVRELLMSVPYIGKAKTDKIMLKLHIAQNRRVQGLGSRQRAALIVISENGWQLTAE